jgi:3',5'-cyclic AMP phosphodiesterase CpdA
MYPLLVVVVFSLLIAVDGSLAPRHIYLSLTGDPTQMQVTFTTSTMPTTAQVIYWQQTSNVQITVKVTPSDTHKFVRPVTGITEYISSVTLTSITPHAFNYQILGDSTDKTTLSETYMFYGMTNNSPYAKVAIYGDLGATGYSLVQRNDNGLVGHAKNYSFSTIIHNGDLAYNLASLEGGMSDAFMSALEDISARIPYMVTAGNHEFMDSGHSEVYYNNLFIGQDLAGKNSNSTNTRMWYSFDVGCVHFVCISTEVYCEDTKNAAEQYAWLENDLKQTAARKDDPWVVVLGHRPLYSGVSSYLHSRLMRKGIQCTDASLSSCDALAPCDSGVNCAYSLEKIFITYKVDMFNAGHEHVYVRNNPITPNMTYEQHPNKDVYVDPQHPLYIISGAAGVSAVPTVEDEAIEPTATPAVLQVSTFSYSILLATNNTYMEYSQISSVDGSTIDSFVIQKTRSNNPPTFTQQPFSLNVDKQARCDQ